jgi:hypothetical protein
MIINPDDILHALELAISSHENEIAFLKWVRYNLKMGWI